MDLFLPSPETAAEELRAAREANDAARRAFTAELLRTGVVPADGTPVAVTYTAADERLERARATYRAALAAR